MINLFYDGKTRNPPIIEESGKFKYKGTDLHAVAEVFRDCRSYSVEALCLWLDEL